MSSPFVGFANATLIFQVPGVTTINTFGNPQAPTTELEVTAILRKSNRQPTVILNPGADIDLILVTGRCISPIELPAELVAQSVAQAVIDGQEGEFVLSANVHSPFIPRSVLGQAIEGHFRVRKLWGDSLEL